MDKQEGVKISLDNLGLMFSSAASKIQANQRETEDAGPPSLQTSFIFLSNNDSDDGESIVVLGKNSLDAIQKQTLSSYQHIRQKSLSMDCKSIISSLTPSELEQRLTEVLQENLRLKETLEQNNSTMMEHLKTLATRQDELSKVYEAHKLKFAETKNLVTVLRTENNEYKSKLEEKNIKSTEQTTLRDNVEDINDTSTVSMQTENEMRIQKLALECEHRNQEIAHMEKIIASLKQQLESFYQHPFDSFKLETSNSSDHASEDPRTQYFLENFKRYNEKLEILSNCYIAQISRYTNIQEYLRRCSEILMEKQDSNMAEESHNSSESSKFKELQELRNKLIAEELNTISERQEMIKSQNEFQKIFTDYNSALLEIESLRKERDNLKSLQEGASLYDDRLEKARASWKESEKLLKDEKRELEQVRVDLIKQKEKIEHEGNRLQKQERKLVEANASLLEETASIRESNEVLREQLKVYETDWAEQLKLRDTMRLEKNELLIRVQKLEEERNELMSTLQYLRVNPID